MDNYDPFVAFCNEEIPDWTDSPKFTFARNLGTVTVRDRVAVANPDGSWTVFYQNPRTARIADDGTLVHYITNRCYFAYSDVFAFQRKQDNFQKEIAFKEPLSFPTFL